MLVVLVVLHFNEISNQQMTNVRGVSMKTKLDCFGKL